MKSIHKQTTEVLKNIAAPVLLAERIALLDILRGFAIFGILLVNMQIFYQPIILVQLGYADPVSSVDIFSNAMIKLFFEGKFFMLFSILFGYGFYIFMNKTGKKDQPVTQLFLRRIFILFLFGVMHVIVFWAGDILLIYAVLGIALLLFRKISDKGILIWSIIFSLMAPIIMGSLALFAEVAMKVPAMALELQEELVETREMTIDLIREANYVYSNGEFSEMVEVRLKEYQLMLIGVISLYPTILGMFLIGYLAARRQLFKRIRLYHGFFRKMLILGAAIGIPSSIIYTYAGYKAPPYIPDIYSFLSMLFHNIGGFFMCLFYVSAISLMYINGRFLRAGKILAPVGRMALTNYLMQTVICTTLFFSYGFGFFGKIGYLEGLIIALIIFASQIVFSTAWLKFFKYGPLEWIWRIMTYRIWQPIRQVS